jgi:isoleucyl-tRNA synthetase
MEGNVRDLVRGIQNLRKESGLEVTDRITLTVSGSPSLKSAYTMFSDYIASETLAVKILWTDSGEGFVNIEAGEEMWSAKIEKM